MSSRVQTESRICTCKSHRFFAVPKPSRASYRAPCSHRILPCISLLGSVRNNADTSSGLSRVHQLEEVDAAHVFRRFPPSRDVCIQSSRPPLCCNPLRRFGCARSQGNRDICCFPRSASFRRCLASSVDLVILPRRTTLRCAPRTPMSSTASSALTLTMGHKRRPLMTLGSSRSIVSFGSSIISQMLAVTSIPPSILAISVSLPVRRNLSWWVVGTHPKRVLGCALSQEAYQRRCYYRLSSSWRVTLQ
jgi:hypothetical protein